jgi:hypothetical protein
VSHLDSAKAQNLKLIEREKVLTAHPISLNAEVE